MEENTSKKFSLEGSRIRAVLSNRKIPAGAKVVLFNLIFRLGRKTYAFPSQKRIADDIGLSERQVRNHLKLLREMNIIEWERGVFNPYTHKMANVNSYNLGKILKEERE